MSVLDDLRAGATRKLGPLPAYAWGAVAAAGIWLWRSIRRPQSKRAAQGATPDTVGFSGRPLIPALSGGAPVGPSTPFAPPAGPPSPLFISTPDLAAEGEPGAVLTAIDAFLAAQRQPVEAGGAAASPPPPPPAPTQPAVTQSPAPAPQPAPQPKPKPAAPDPCNPANFPTYTVRRGDTMRRIAAKLYGSEGAWVTGIKPFNQPRSGSWDMIFPGEVFRYKPSGC